MNSSIPPPWTRAAVAAAVDYAKADPEIVLIRVGISHRSWNGGVELLRP